MNPTLQLLDSAHITDVLDELTQELQRKKREPLRWCCALCKAVITDDDCKVQINGTHEHYKVNPQGSAFQFRSYSNAEGCAPTGEATEEYSWFSGYRWRFAQCATCHTQLGWYFSGSDSFYGLITDQLVRCNNH